MDFNKIPLHKLKFIKKFQEKYFIFLVVAVLAAMFLTAFYLVTQTIFGYDMARDAFHAYDIFFKHDLMILGPGTDIPGLNHGVLWFYFLVIPYFLAGQDPSKAVVVFFLLSMFTIPFVWLLSERLFKNKTISLVGTVLYSFSPLVVALASWMSNPILCLYATPPLLLVLYSFLAKPSAKKSFVIGILYGVLIQSQLANLLLLITIPMFLVIFRIKPSVKVVFTFLIGITMVLSSYILVEIAFHWRGIAGLLAFLKNHHGSGPKFQFMADKWIEFFNLTTFPFAETVVILCIFLSLFLLIRNYRNAKKPLTFLLVWLSNILFFTYFDTGVSHSSFVFIPSIVAGVLLISYLFVVTFKNKYLIGIVVATVVLFQLNTVITWQRNEFSPAAIQRSNTTYRYKQVVDYTYKNSGENNFTIVTVTNPLFINTTWAYLYEFYGKRKYGYEPFWGGKGQTGYPGNLVEKPFGTRDRYLIIESTIGVPSIYVTKAIYEEDRVSDIVEEKKFGYVIVQKRVLVESKSKIPIPEELKNSSILYE